jgi:branched-chain amino acid transport system ATP-binding protein
MLAMSRALMCNPKLVLMDEPSVGLSPVMEAEIAKIIKTINERGIGVLLVEQNAAMALRLANRGYVIETGRIVLCDECSVLLNNEQVKKAYLGG